MECYVVVKTLDYNMAFAARLLELFSRLSRASATILLTALLPFASDIRPANTAHALGTEVCNLPGDLHSAP
jgi:hypothetical protein